MWVQLSVTWTCVVCTANTEILLDMVGKLQSESVALVHQIPFTTDQKDLAHIVEKVGESYLY